VYVIRDNNFLRPYTGYCNISQSWFNDYVSRNRTDIGGVMLIVCMCSYFCCCPATKNSPLSLARYQVAFGRT